MTPKHKKTVVSLRLDSSTAQTFRVEAARRGLKLNALFEQMLSDLIEKDGGSSE